MQAEVSVDVITDSRRLAMIFDSILDRFAREAPVPVMLRATMESVFSEEAIDELFEQTAQQQRSGELLFSSVVNILTLVVCSVRKSVNAAYLAAKDRVGFS